MKYLEKIETIFKGKYGKKIIIVIGIAIILLIFLSEFDMFGKSEENIQEYNTSDDTEFLDNTENQIKEITESITGDSSPKVAVSLESGTEYIYATTTQAETGVKKNNGGNENVDETSDKSTESYIIINTGSGEQPLLVSEISPKLRGVAVVCNLGDNEAVADKLSIAISTLLNIPQKKISISGKN